MKRNYRKMPSGTVNHYIGEYLEQEDIMPMRIGNGQPTIVPGGQTRELMDATEGIRDRAPAFIVYGFELDQHSNDVISHCERMGYTIYSSSAGTVLEIIHVFKDLFGQADVSANRINRFAERERLKNPEAAGGRNIHFFDFEYEVVGGPLPTRDDGGRFGGAVNLHYSYNYTTDTCGLKDSTIFP